MKNIRRHLAIGELDSHSINFLMRSNLQLTPEDNKYTLVFSFVADRFLKIGHFFSQNMYLSERKLFEMVIEAQDTRLENMERKTRNVRDIEDNNLKRMKLDLYNLQHHFDIKEKNESGFEEDSEEIICVGENEEELPSPSSGSPVETRKKLADVWKELGKKSFLKKQTKISEVDQYIKEMELSGMFNNLIENLLAERDVEPDDSSLEEAKIKRCSVKGLSTEKSLYFRMRSSKLIFDQPTEVHTLLIQIKVKRNLIFFYDLFEKTLTELRMASTVTGLKELQLDKKVKEMKKILKESLISRMYLIDILTNELAYREDFFDSIEIIRDNYKTSLGKIVEEKRQTLRTAQSLFLHKESPINPLKQKDFTRDLTAYTKGRKELTGLLQNVSGMIKEYLELKESMFGVKIGDEKAVFEYYVKQALKSSQKEENQSNESSIIEEEDSDASDIISEADNHSQRSSNSSLVFDNLAEFARRYSIDNVLRLGKEKEKTGENNNRDSFYKQYKDPTQRFKFVQIIFKSENTNVWMVEERATSQIFAIKRSKRVEFTEISKILGEEGPVESLNDYVVRTLMEFKHGGWFYRVMDYMENHSLRLFLNSNSEIMTKVMIKKIIANIMLCVEACHASRCVGIAINPDKVLVDRKGKTKLLTKGVDILGRILLSRPKDKIFKC